MWSFRKYTPKDSRHNRKPMRKVIMFAEFDRGADGLMLSTGSAMRAAYFAERRQSAKHIVQKRYSDVWRKGDNEFKCTER